MTTLEERVLRIEDIEAIRSMKMAYARYCDDDYKADEIAELFTEDGVWDGGVFGVYNGRDHMGPDGVILWPGRPLDSPGSGRRPRGSPGA